MGPTRLADRELPDPLTSITLKIQGTARAIKFFYQTGQGEFEQLGPDLPSSYLNPEKGDAFQGVTLGVFAHN
jgi:hypothetical protein